MNKQIICLKEASSYDDILKNTNNKIPLFFKKIIFLYKNVFNIITKKNIEGNNIWILPVKEKYQESKINKLIKKGLMNSNNIYLISNELKNNKIHKIMEEYKIEYITEEKIKKILLIDILKYIINIQKTELSNLEVTILTNNTSNLNIYLIEEIAKLVKNLKIISLNIYKFKKIEEELYNEYGIAIQFSNSYKNSLAKSKIIVNLDFNETEINEYEIFTNAIIVNCIKDNIKIKSRLFNGIVINSIDVEFNKEIANNFKNIHIYEDYKRLQLYASIIENEEDILKLKEKIKLDNLNITSLIGNNGLINKKEFKNINKKLDKNRKTE